MDMQIEKFDRDNLDLIRALMNQKFSELGIEDITCEVGKCTYNATSATFQVTLKTSGNEVVSEARLRDAVRLWITTSIGPIEMENDRWKLVDYKPRNRKYPFIMLKKETNQKFKMSQRGVYDRLKVSIKNPLSISRDIA